MFGWRKKPDGFEWHEYIRTTIKVRREARRQRVLDARRAAAHQANAAGAALAAGSRAAGAAAMVGARAGFGAAREGSRAGLGAASLLLQGLYGAALDMLRTVGRPLADVLARPNVAGPLAVAAAIALGAGIGRTRSAGLDREALTTLLIAFILFAGLLPMLTRIPNFRFPRLGVSISGRQALIGGAVLALAGAAWLATSSGGGKIAAGLGRLPLIGSAPLQGRAYAVSGDMLRVGDTTVRLANLEAPEREQRCSKGGKAQWRCGATAASALSRLVDGRTLQCTRGGSDDGGRPLATCMRNGKDVGAEMVRQGHAFAQGTVFVTYSSEEREARAAKAGLWSGDAERPAAYRAKVWDEAKRRAPDGCPIKGQVTGAARVYVLPWSPDYERARVQKARGERWFCSEQEAVAAGFKAAEKRG